MALVSPHISKIPLNVNGLNLPIKRHRVAEWINEQTQIYAAFRSYTSAVKTNVHQKWRDGRWCSKQMAAKRKWV